jgi:hypothetical protein
MTREGYTSGRIDGPERVRTRSYPVHLMTEIEAISEKLLPLG